jgi:hypothetical protein
MKQSFVAAPAGAGRVLLLLALSMFAPRTFAQYNFNAKATPYYETSQRTFTTDVVIKAGAHVILSAEWAMDYNKKITIQKGALLTIDGGGITSSGSPWNAPPYWKGIEVWGDSTKDQSQAGNLENDAWFLQNNNWATLGYGAIVLRSSNSAKAYITQSFYGVVLGQFGSAPNYIYPYSTGGVIRCSGTSFANNAYMSVGFAPSRGSARGSRIKNGVTFEIHGQPNLPANQRVKRSAFIRMMHAPNDTTSAFLSYSDFGYLSFIRNKGCVIDTVIGIESQETFGLTNSYFRNLDFGIIYTTPFYSAANYNAEIKNCTLDTCKVGIYTKAIYGRTNIYNNTFKVMKKEGILCEGTDQMYIYNNTFKYCLYGSRLRAMGPLYSEVDGNTYIKCNYGMYYEANNKATHTWCNQFDSTTKADIAKPNGQLADQLLPCNQINYGYELPNNSFSYPNVLAANLPAGFYHINNTSGVVLRYYIDQKNSQYDPQKTNGLVTKGNCFKVASCTKPTIKAEGDGDLKDDYDYIRSAANIIINTQNPSSDELEALAYYQQLMQGIKYEQFDRAIQANQVSDAIALFDGDKTFAAYHKLFGYYMGMHNYTEAASILSHYANYTGSDPYIIDFYDMGMLMLSGYQASDFSAWLASYYTDVKAIADRGNTYAATQAQNLINWQSANTFVGDSSDTLNLGRGYSEIYPPSDADGLDNGGMPDSSMVGDTNTLADILIYPNPVGDDFTAALSNYAQSNTIFVFKVVNSTGATVMQQTVNISQATTINMLFDFASPISGNYTAMLMQNGNILAAQAFVKN